MIQQLKQWAQRIRARGDASQPLKRVNEALNEAQADAVVVSGNPAQPDIAPPVVSETLPPITHPAPPKRAVTPHNVSQEAIALLHHFEGLATVGRDGLISSYRCPAGVWTIGWGATGRDPFNGGQIGPNTVWTREQADIRFKQHLAQFERDTRAALTIPTTQGQFDALVSFAYNLGNAALNRSTLLRLHNAGNFDGAAKQFVRWNRAGGKVLRGLTRRREAEANMYRGQPWR